MVGPPPEQALEAAAARVRELAEGYEPPDYAEIPGPDPALFLCAIDHQTGFEGSHEVDGQGPYEGSALLWALGLRAEKKVPGAISARSLLDVAPEPIEAVFRVEGKAVAGAERRAALWRDLARRLAKDYGGEAQNLIAASEGRLEKPGGMLHRLSAFEAYSDPLRKKSLLFCKIAERRGWLEVADPENWQVCADNVLMRLALRSGLVEQGEVDAVREATRDAFRAVGDRAEIPPPVLDDLLWERGRDDADLLGAAAGDLREPERKQGDHFY